MKRKRVLKQFDSVYDESVFQEFLKLLPHLKVKIADLVQYSTAASILGSTQTYIDNLINQGKLGVIRIDKTNYVLRSEVLAIRDKRLKRLQNEE
jgi:hypothetical protein